MGYHRAGFDVVGVDIKPQPRFPFEFHQADALEFLQTYSGPGFHALHASPPCQAYSRARRIQANPHPDLVGRVRGAFQLIGLPWVIENVRGAPLRNPAELCGMMFGLNVYRHRLFETSFPLSFILHPAHHARQVKMGRPGEGDIIQPVGNFSNVAYARKAMDIPWMTQSELAQAIPPAYTLWVGQQLLHHLGADCGQDAKAAS